MQVQATISAPSSMYSNLTKSNLRKKEVHLTGVNWETADFMCNSCGHMTNGYGNYVLKLEAEVEWLRKRIHRLERRHCAHGH